MKCRKKVCSLLLSMCLTAGMLPMAAFAADETRIEQANAAALPFTDVSEGDWFYPYVKYAYEHGLMSGVSATEFAPQQAVNRAMVVQILYAQAGKPAVSGGSSFSDVKQGDWYYDAVVWAEQTGVTAGENGKFNPNQSTTREQFAVMLYANAGKPAASGDLSGFADAASVSSWAQPGMTWANQNGLISGEQRNGAMYLNPQGLATRAQGATIFKAYNENVLGITEAARGTCGDNLTWVLDSEGTLTISGTGAMDNWNSEEDTPWSAYRDRITSVQIGDGATSIGNCAFDECDNLTGVTISNSVTSIGNWAFTDCERLAGVVIPDSVTSISKGAFYDCERLARVTIGSGVTSIGDWALAGCDALTNVTIPANVTSIGYEALRDCDSLTEIAVAADNAAYSSLDGVLFNKDQTTLVQYPGGKSGAYAIPSGVTRIGESAFSDCEKLTGVTIPNSVVYIDAYAFYDCENLTSVILPDSVTRIGEGAFEDCGNLRSVTIGIGMANIDMAAFSECDSLTDVYYRGSEAQWAAINISDSNEPLLEATIHYNYEG